MMKFTIEKNRLLQSINVVSKGMSSRSTLPIFTGIFIEATVDGLVFQTTDLEISIKHITEALIEKRGATVVPGKLFNNIIKSLPEAAITIELIGELLSISCLESSFTVSVMNPIDYPSFPQIIAERTIEISSKLVSDAVKKVSKAVSRDESRAVLTGIFFKVDEQELQLVATDSYRLAISKIKLSEKVESPLELIIPGMVFEEITRLISNEDILQIGEAENQILFQFGKTTFVSRKIEGNYPNYEQIVPQQHLVSAKVKTADLLDAVRRAAVLAQNHSSIRFIIDQDAQCIEVKTQSQEIGSSSEKVSSEIEGSYLEIGFNHQYVIDGLNAITTEEMLFEAQTPLKPGIFKAIDSNFYFYLTMPVRLD